MSRNTHKILFSSLPEQIRCYHLLGTCWEPLYSPSQEKRTRNNGRRWIHSGMIKSRKMIFYSAVLKQLHAASCLSVSPSKKKKRDRAGHCLMSASHQGWVEPKTKSWISDSTCFTLQIFSPIFCHSIPPPSSFTGTTERHGGLYSFISMLLQAGRPAAGSEISFRMADTILPPGKRIIRVKRQPCSVRCESESRTYVEFWGLPQKSSSSSNGSDSDNNRERHILETLERS